MDTAYQFGKRPPFTAWSVVPMDRSITLPRQSALAAANSMSLSISLPPRSTRDRPLLALFGPCAMSELRP